MPPRPGERRRTGGEGGISSQLGKASRRKALEGKGPRNGVETGVVAGESGENKSGGLLRRAVRDGCYEFDCPPAGPSLPPHLSCHLPPRFPFFRVPYPRLRNISPRFPTPTPNREELGLRETSPNKVEKRAVGRMGGINFSLVAPAAFGDDPRSRVGKTCSTTDHRPAARFKGDAPLCRPNKGDR